MRMNILVIVAHPSTASFNRAIADAVVQALQICGHHVVFHDPYDEGFDPILTDREIPKSAVLEHVVERHCTEISRADGIVIVHPNWWGQPPAILKGWIDRVLRPGVAYEFQEGDSGEGIPMGLLKAKAAIVFNTSNTPRDREMEVFGDPLDTLWKNCIFDLCGVQQFYRKMYGVVVTSTPEQRNQWLDEIQETVRRHFPAEDC
jgi:putative NADPH-quinone reductase